ncbi:MAG: hypothetical protein E3J64_06015 [Anaerolineales bacterium]|nr:MAG: hypothetical protein E3J64_06015 [Anaerolineales bacterium]
MTKKPRSPGPSGSATSGLIRLSAGSSGEAGWPISAWAALCGVVASGGFGWEGADWLRLVLLLLLVDGAWGSLWTAVRGADWRAALERWQTWDSSKGRGRVKIKIKRPAHKRFVTWLGQLVAWWREAVWPEHRAELATAVVALLVSAALAVQLGVGLVLASLAALAVLQLALIRGRAGAGIEQRWPGAVSVALSLLGARVLFAAVLPWVAGQLAFGSFTFVSLILAVVFAAAYRAVSLTSMRGRLLGITAQFAVAAGLLALRRPVGAGCVALLLVPQIALLPWLQLDQPVDWYARHARPWLAAAMLVAAGSL